MMKKILFLFFCFQLLVNCGFTPVLKVTEYQNNTLVTYEINPNDEYPKNYTGDITIFKKNGTTISANQSCLRGGKRSPLGVEEIYRKFEANLKFANVKSEKIKELRSKIDTIFNMKNLNEII